MLRSGKPDNFIAGADIKDFTPSAARWRARRCRAQGQAILDRLAALRGARWWRPSTAPAWAAAWRRRWPAATGSPPTTRRRSLGPARGEARASSPARAAPSGCRAWSGLAHRPRPDPHRPHPQGHARAEGRARGRGGAARRSLLDVARARGRGAWPTARSRPTRRGIPLAGAAAAARSSSTRRGQRVLREDAAATTRRRCAAIDVVEQGTATVARGGPEAGGAALRRAVRVRRLARARLGLLRHPGDQEGRGLPGGHGGARGPQAGRGGRGPDGRGHRRRRRRRPACPCALQGHHAGGARARPALRARGVRRAAASGAACTPLRGRSSAWTASPPPSTTPASAAPTS